jgi:phage-related minor tail protein
VAVKVTLLLEQIEVDDALIDTDGVTELAVTVTTLEVAVGVIVQFAFEVMITVTWSPLASELVVNVEELLPAFTPFICH